MEGMKKTKLVYGVGVNDAGYPVNTGSIIDGRYKNVWTCPIYQAWKNILNRCYSEKTLARYPTYIGCSVTPEWRSFSVFREWMLTQDHEGKHLDKDILISGNKVYGPHTCLFVPSDLNLFMNGREALRGEWPIGVSWQKDSGKFRAECCDPFKSRKKYLGLFADPAEAHEAWRARKHELACIYADQQTDPRIAQALRTRYAQGESHDRSN